jgi:hypothetical protein
MVGHVLGLEFDSRNGELQSYQGFQLSRRNEKGAAENFTKTTGDRDQ